ncbi:hypothetical protein [Desulfogranum mediterraneum]|uniref:hypothetical protein n=1 Tax=Desulfogranum mediterraneum TaxID=160661 RepID=UPI00041C9342|nr:hypothetical protein [Desulfogranum mediterraneum]
MLLVVLLLGLPLLGLLAAGKDLSHYWEFPPLTQYVSHAPFSWYVFFALVLLAILVFGFLFFQLHHRHASTALNPAGARAAFPWWGGLGLLLVAASWLVAWNRFPPLHLVQPYTFLPLWLGYIVFINGLSYYRSSSCLLVDRSNYFLALFPISSCFWWFFEYLNRFVQNWHYLGIEDFSVKGYIFHASLCFSTVLPAVLSTEELLATYPRLTEPLKDSLLIPAPGNSLVELSSLAASAVGLLAIGIWPDYLFPLLWLSPLFIILTIQRMLGQATFLDSVSQGDWRPVWLPALAALCCGFFWELWNVHSYAHWVYSVPLVQKAHIFEMPLLGYLGYLPFGLECRAVASLVETILQRDDTQPG